MFSFPLISGDPETILTEPFTIVITPAAAKKYIGDRSPVGQIPTLNNSQDYQVTGIVEAPYNSHIPFDFLVSYVSLESDIVEDWKNLGPGFTYIILPERHDSDVIIHELNDIITRHLDEQYATYFGLDIEPITLIHLQSEMLNDLGSHGNIVFVYVFASIALLILLIACINLVNLTTARSASRAMEVGRRKVLGAQRPQLVAQFLGESLLMSFCVMLLALVFVQILLPAFFTAEQRKKEIGIRKALGASVTNITLLLSREFTFLVVGSLVLAFHAAYFMINACLADFAYRIEISLWINLTAGMVALVLAWLTVSYQAIKAAVADPVKALRYE